MKRTWLASTIVLVLVIILLLLGYETYRQYRYLERAHLAQLQRLHISDLLQHRKLTAADVSYIQPWMTFDYVSAVFVVPIDYLKMNLNISDPRYPYLSLGRYARSRNLNPTDFVGQTENVVYQYLVGTSTISR